MVGIRAQQKEKTRRALINAAFNQLTAEKSFSNLSLREVSREAGIAPTSFYRHFRDMDELGLTMVDEAGLTLRQLMRQARKRIANGGSVIVISVETFFEFINNSPNVFRLLLPRKPSVRQLHGKLNILPMNFRNTLRVKTITPNTSLMCRRKEW